MDDIPLCPEWWPLLLWRLHFPIGGGRPPVPNPVNYPPAINDLMAGLHIHTLSYLMKDQAAAQEIRTKAEQQMVHAAQNLSKSHAQAATSR